MATGGADAPIDIIEIDDSEDDVMEVESKSEVSSNPIEKESASEPPEYVMSPCSMLLICPSPYILCTEELMFTTLNRQLFNKHAKTRVDIEL